jgi:prepilin-type N-terminal cleavage/methylation domain-containing protein
MRLNVNSYRRRQALLAGRRGAARGFTLVEMMIAMGVMTLLVVALSNTLTPAISFYGKQQTNVKLADLQQAFEISYRDEAPVVNAGTGQIWTLSLGAIAPVVVNPGGRCESNPDTFGPLRSYLSGSASDAWRDGHGQGMCVFVTGLLSGTAGGYSYPYRSVAVVSAGLDGTIDPTSRLSADGVLTLAGDDRGFIVDGRKAALGQVQDAVRKIDRLADAYGTYFNTRFMSNVARDVAINYFANTDPSGATSTLYDTAGAMPSTRGAAVAVTSIGAHTILGLTVDDVTDPWGRVLLIDNSSDAVRHPGNASPALRAPGYTARITTPVPGTTQVIARTVVGSF